MPDDRSLISGILQWCLKYSATANQSSVDDNTYVFLRRLRLGQKPPHSRTIITPAPGGRHVVASRWRPAPKWFADRTFGPVAGRAWTCAGSAATVELGVRIWVIRAWDTVGTQGVSIVMVTCVKTINYSDTNSTHVNCIQSSVQSVHMQTVHIQNVTVCVRERKCLYNYRDYNFISPLSLSLSFAPSKMWTPWNSRWQMIFRHQTQISKKH